jgi:PAS domain S-box-containing protein
VPRCLSDRTGFESTLLIHGALTAVAIGASVWRRRMARREFQARWALEQAEHQLRESQARTASIVADALDCIITVDASGRIVEWNAAATTTFGQPRDLALGRTLADLIVPPALRDAHCRGFARHLATGESTILGTRLETVAMRADGTEFPVELSVSRGEVDGAPVFTAYLRDITERRRFEDALTATNARLEEEAGIAATLQRVGATLGENLGRDDLPGQVAALTHETLGCEWSAIFVPSEPAGAFRLEAASGLPPPTCDALAARVASRAGLGFEVDLLSGEPVLLAPGPPESDDPLEPWTTATRLVIPIARDGALVAVLVCGYRLPCRLDEHLRRLTAGFAQATAVALANAHLIRDLQTANRLKTEFVSTMSHELRTPLNVIIGYVEMIRDAPLEPTTRDECVGRIEAAARQLLDLIEDALRAGRLEAGLTKTEIERLALPELWRQIGDGCALIRRHEGVQLVWDDAPAVAVLTDAGKLTVIVRNLIGNAIKFTHAGSVRASLALDGEALIVRVADTGIGIPPEHHERIFEMFRQVDGSDRRAYGGSGLGLHIVHRFVDLLGGSITLESAPGRGAVFTVRLPVAPEPLAPAAPSEAA